MGRRMRRAVVSVHDKSGVAAFARALVEEFGMEILSTGGTAKLLAESGVPVTLVEDVTGSGEMLDGRVKTLHPRIHAGILADRDNPEHSSQLRKAGIEPIDMVVINLYPFARTIERADCTLAEAIENIDIGGPCMLRAAAKNHRHVLAVHQPQSYDDVLDALRAGGGDVSGAFRMRQAVGAFRATAAYDRLIEEYLSRHCGEAPEASVRRASIALRHVTDLRYGENPHQRAALWGIDSIDGIDAGGPGGGRLVDARQVGGEAMSFNNYSDADAALSLCAELTHELGRACCVFIKHSNACGVGVADDGVEAYRRAYLGDPNAAMGGILACNMDVNVVMARTVMETYEQLGKDAGAGGFFLEVWLAPKFDAAAIEAVQASKTWGRRVRLMEIGSMAAGRNPKSWDITGIDGGLLLQTPDALGLDESSWSVVTKRRPSETEMADLRLAWLICKHTKSNAITICRDGMLIGNGAGQMSRVMSCRIATWLAKENGHTERLRGAAAASDAFFPFRDGPTQLMDAGVTAIIQPGGSKRDDDTIAACDDRGCAMVFTGTRHFRH